MAAWVFPLLTPSRPFPSGDKNESHKGEEENAYEIFIAARRPQEREKIALHLPERFVRCERGRRTGGSTVLGSTPLRVRQASRTQGNGDVTFMSLCRHRSGRMENLELSFRMSFLQKVEEPLTLHSDFLLVSVCLRFCGLTCDERGFQSANV